MQAISTIWRAAPRGVNRRLLEEGERIVIAGVPFRDAERHNMMRIAFERRADQHLFRKTFRSECVEGGAYSEKVADFPIRECVGSMSKLIRR
jgi:hypothetical protein